MCELNGAWSIQSPHPRGQAHFMTSRSADLQPKFPMTAAISLGIQTGRLREMYSYCMVRL